MTTNASVVATNIARPCSGKAHYVPEASEPSLFTQVKDEINPLWVDWFATRYKLSKKTAGNIAVALHDYLVAGEGYELPKFGPANAYIQGTHITSMEFVLDCSRRYDLPLHEACVIAESLKKVDLSGKGYAFFEDANLLPHPKVIRLLN